MVGNIYLSDDHRGGEKRPGIVANSSWTGVNEVYLAMFARQMIAHGFVCMGFDYRSFKPSGGTGGMDKYTTLEMEIDDISNAVTFFKYQPEVDANHIALIDWGVGDVICITAAHRDETVKAVATLSPSTGSRYWMRIGMGNDKFNKILHTLKEDKYKRVTTDDPALRHPYELCPNIDESSDFYMERTLKNPNGGAKGDIEVECGEPFPTSMSSVIAESFVRFNVRDILPKPTPDCVVFIDHGKYSGLHDKEEAKDACRLASESERLCYMDGKHSEWMFDKDPKLGGLCNAMVELFRAHT